MFYNKTSASNDSNCKLEAKESYFFLFLSPNQQINKLNKKDRVGGDRDNLTWGLGYSLIW